MVAIRKRDNLMNMRAEIDKLRREIDTALRVFYTLKKLVLMQSDPNTVSKLNSNPDFWLMHQYSLTMNLFIYLRRLYEGGSKSFNFQQFIRNCIENIDQFSAESLRGRQINRDQGNGDFDIDKYIDKYIENTYQPTEDDFKKLSRKVRCAKGKEMKNIATQLASKAFAHAVYDDKEVDDLTNQLSFDDIEEALLSIWNCHRQIRQMYDNGRKPDFCVDEYPHKQEIYDSVSKQV